MKNNNPGRKIVGRMIGRCWINNNLLGEYRVNVDPIYYATWELTGLLKILPIASL